MRCRHIRSVDFTSCKQTDVFVSSVSVEQSYTGYRDLRAVPIADQVDRRTGEFARIFGAKTLIIIVSYNLHLYIVWKLVLSRG